MQDVGWQKGNMLHGSVVRSFARMISHDCYIFGMCILKDSSHVVSDLAISRNTYNMLARLQHLRSPVMQLWFGTYIGFVKVLRCNPTFLSGYQTPQTPFPMHTQHSLARYASSLMHLLYSREPARPTKPSSHSCVSCSSCRPL